MPTIFNFFGFKLNKQMITRDDIQRMWTDGERLYALTTDGRQASYRFADWPRLAAATPRQREAYTLSHCGIHWPEIDEDLTIEGMFRER